MPRLYRKEGTTPPGKYFFSSGGKSYNKFANFEDDFENVTNINGVSICPVYTQTNCGNGKVDSGEECDNSWDCDIRTCKCMNSRPVNGICVGCGDKIVQDDEVCDGQSWCSNTCQDCKDGYTKVGSKCMRKAVFGVIIAVVAIAGIFIVVASVSFCVF